MSDKRPSEIVRGFLEVGRDEQGQVVINHPDLKPDKDGVGHIVFSPAQALNLAWLLEKHAGVVPTPPAESLSGERLDAIERRNFGPQSGPCADLRDIRNLIAAVRDLQRERDELKRQLAEAQQRVEAAAEAADRECHKDVLHVVAQALEDTPADVDGRTAIRCLGDALSEPRESKGVLDRYVATQTAALRDLVGELADSLNFVLNHRESLKASHIEAADALLDKAKRLTGGTG